MAAAPIGEHTRRLIRETFAELGNITVTATRLKLSRDTVRKYLADAVAAADCPADLPPAKHEAPEPVPAPADEFPDPHREEYTPHTLNTAGQWLILSDVHAPYHDRSTIEAAVKEARRRNVVGVILNGDTMDSHEVSRHDKDPSAPRYVEEVSVTRKLLGWLRGQLPRAELRLKEGNHEERLASYIIGRAPALFGLEGLDIPSLLHLDDIGAEWVSGRRVVALGKLNVIHGHEFPGGCTSPVNPARGLYLKARSVAICGHHHQTSEHHARNIRGQAEAAWSLGCACFLSPRYMPLNNWNLGCAFVDVCEDGSFGVENKRFLGGKLI